MDSKTPFVTIIIPTYNAEQHVEETIKSVQNQTYDNWELIVVDDCSNDSTCSIVKQIMEDDNRISLLKNDTNIGVAETRNKGLDACKGEYVAFLDADDIWYCDKLKKQIELAKIENADIVYSSYDIIDVSGCKVKSSYIVPENVSFDELLKENVIGCSSVLMNGEVARKYRFNNKFYHEDYVLWLQILADGGKAVGCRQTLTAWRYMQNSRSFNKQSAAKERWLIYRRFCRLSAIKSVVLMCLYAKAALKKYRWSF